MNTGLREKAKNDFKNFFFKLMNNSVFRNSMKNVRKHRDIKITTKLLYHKVLYRKFVNNRNKEIQNIYESTSLLGFIVYIKTDNICKDIAKGAEARFDSSKYELDRTLPKGKNKKIIGLMKDEKDGKIMKEFVKLRAKTYSCL